MTKRDKDEEQLDVLMSFLAESVAQTSDEEIVEEYGNDSPPRTKEILRAAVKEVKKQKLRVARAVYESSAVALKSRSYALPQSNFERRSLLGAILTQMPDLKTITFTAQHRELNDLTDTDIESFLKQLAELGLLDAFLKGQ